MNVTVLGAGRLGKPMAERLQAVGCSVTLYNRTLQKIAGLSPAGIFITDQPEIAICRSDCVILMLADAPAIRDVLLTGPARSELRGRTVIQMGTIGPSESQAIEAEIQAVGGHYLEAPVLGSIAEARAGKLVVMVGATQEQFLRWKDLLRSFSLEPRLIGPVGRAAALKLVLNHFIAVEMAAFALSLGVIQSRGISVDTFMEVLRESTLYTPMFDKNLPRLLIRDYSSPNFSTRHMFKDVNLFLEEASRVGLDTSSLGGMPDLLLRTIERGLGDGDYSALYETVNPPGSDG